MRVYCVAMQVCAGSRKPLVWLRHLHRHTSRYEMRTTFSAMWPVIYLFTVLGALVFIVIVAVTVYRLSREQERRQNLRRLLPWLIKGFMLPFALWVVMNLGISWQLQPFMPQVQAAQNSGTNWIPAFLHVIAAGLFAVSS